MLKYHLIYSSLELKDYDVAHEIKVLRRIKCGSILVELAPPISAKIFETSADITTAVLTPRYSKYLFPLLFVGKIYVNLFIGNNGVTKAEDKLRFADIGELTKRWYWENSKTPNGPGTN